jgi:hypothetical protein
MPNPAPCPSPSTMTQPTRKNPRPIAPGGGLLSTVGRLNWRPVHNPPRHWVGPGRAVAPSLDNSHSDRPWFRRSSLWLRSGGNAVPDLQSIRRGQSTSHAGRVCAGHSRGRGILIPPRSPTRDCGADHFERMNFAIRAYVETTRAYRERIDRSKVLSGSHSLLGSSRPDPFCGKMRWRGEEGDEDRILVVKQYTAHVAPDTAQEVP